MAIACVTHVNFERFLAVARVRSDECIVFEWFGVEGPRVGDSITGFLEAVGDQLLHNVDQGKTFPAHIHLAYSTCERATAYGERSSLRGS